jgi:NUMOD4 motif.
MNEIWRDVKGFEGLYQVSDWGNIRTLGNNKYKKLKH